jgi:hypothetical protein
MENNIEIVLNETDETSCEKINDILTNEPADKIAEEIVNFISGKIKKISK